MFRYSGSCGGDGPELFIDGQRVYLEYSDKVRVRVRVREKGLGSRV
jgi:hypothetical protein